MSRHHGRYAQSMHTSDSSDIGIGLGRLSVAMIWKQSFSLQAGEFVAEMVLIEHDGRYLVDHVMVF